MVFPCPELSMCIRHLFQFMFVVQLYLVSVVSGSWCLVVYDFRCFVSWWWCTMVKTIRDTWKQSKPISLDHHSTLGHLVWEKKAFQRIQLWFTANTWCMFLKTRGHQVPLLPMPGPGPTVKVFASNVGQGVQPSDARGLVACSCDNSWLNKLSRSAWPLIAFLCSNGVLFARPCWAISMCWNPKVIRLNMV